MVQSPLKTTGDSVATASVYLTRMNFIRQEFLTDGLCTMPIALIAAEHAITRSICLRVDTGVDETGDENTVTG